VELNGFTRLLSRGAFFSYLFAAIVAYYILSAIVPFLIVALIGWIVACVINQNKRGR